MRAFCAGLVLASVMLIGGEHRDTSLSFILHMPVWLPIGYLLICGPGSFMLGLLAVVGQPLVYLIHKSKPQWVALAPAVRPRRGTAPESVPTTSNR